MGFHQQLSLCNVNARLYKGEFERELPFLSLSIKRCCCIVFFGVKWNFEFELSEVRRNYLSSRFPYFKGNRLLVSTGEGKNNAFPLNYSRAVWNYLRDFSLFSYSRRKSLLGVNWNKTGIYIKVCSRQGLWSKQQLRENCVFSNPNGNILICTFIRQRRN